MYCYRQCIPLRSVPLHPRHDFVTRGRICCDCFQNPQSLCPKDEFEIRRDDTNASIIYHEVWVKFLFVHK